MKIAIPIYGNRVMPRFGYTRDMIIVTVEEHRIVSHKHLTMTPERLASLPSVLDEEQVTVLICGGIDPRFQHALQEQQIQLIWGVVGEWQEVLQAYLNGTLQTNAAFCLHRGAKRRHCLRQGQQRR